MISASGLSPDDARSILARRTTEALEGGQLARLTSARRQGLERLATRLGLRAFDASLVIAIVQDAARTGEGSTAEVEGRLGLVGGARGDSDESPRHATGSMWGSVLAASTVASIGVLMLIRWVTGG